MDLLMNEEQKMVKESFRRFMEKECSSELVRKWEESDAGYCPELWKKMAELGWLGMGLPSKYGGFEGEFLYLIFLYEEMGKVLFPSPHFLTVVMAGHIINACAEEKLKDSILNKVSKGEIIIAPALLEENRVFDLSKVHMEASCDNGDYVLKGRKQYVGYAHKADYLLCSARIKGGEVEDFSLFLIPANRPGINIVPLKVISGDKLFDVNFKGVRCREEEIIGEIHKGKSVILNALDRWKIIYSARMLGSARGAFEMTLRYAKEREQFGSKIALFQDISFRLAEMATQIDGAGVLLYKAAWKVDQTKQVRKESAMVKAYISRLYRRVTAEAIQIHGGFGFMLEADPQLFYRRAKVDEVFFGNGGENWNVVAEEMGF